MPKMPGTSLTPRQQAFINEYLIDLNATQAAARAGYSVRTARSQGQRMLTKVDIEAAIQVATEARSKRTEIDQDWVVNELAGVVAQGRAAVEVLTREGESTGEYTANLSAANKALELLGRHLGMFLDRQEVDVRVYGRFVIGTGYGEPEEPNVVEGQVVNVDAGGRLESRR